MTRAQTPSARADLHLRALQAALSATLALGLGACAGKPSAGPGGGALTGADSGAAVDGADSGGLAEDSGGLAEDSGGDAEDSGGATGLEGCAEVPPEALADCCLDLQAACAAAFPADFDAAYDCAFGAATGCTPWGPPVPPALA
jgi:hypothetical protein